MIRSFCVSLCSGSGGEQVKVTTVSSYLFVVKNRGFESNIYKQLQSSTKVLGMPGSDNWNMR